MPSRFVTCAKCSVACPKYTIRPDPSSKGRECTPGVISRKSVQFFRAAIGICFWNSPSMFSTFDGFVTSIIGDSPDTVMVSVSVPSSSVTSTWNVAPARIRSPSRWKTEKPVSSAVSV